MEVYYQLPQPSFYQLQMRFELIVIHAFIEYFATNYSN